MGAVHQLFARPEDVDAAWERFAKLGSRLRDEPELLIDRKFMESLASAEREWKRLFMAQEPGE
jgi:hypothetical protein